MEKFEFIIDGPPVSQQARRRERRKEWVERVKEAIRQYWPAGERPVLEQVILTITSFHEGNSLDVDNIPKPILDALKGLVYIDDDQVTDLVCRKRNLNDDLRVVNSSSVLAEGFDRGNEFLYVVVEDAPNQEVVP